jgi:hypothetical protein
MSKIRHADSVLAQRWGAELLTHPAFYKYVEATMVPFKVSRPGSRHENGIRYKESESG